VSSVVNRIENCEEPVPTADADEELPEVAEVAELPALAELPELPELEHPASTTATALTPAATAKGSRRGRWICLFTSNPFFDEIRVVLARRRTSRRLKNS
jgi:hypothetical protein